MERAKCNRTFLHFRAYRSKSCVPLLLARARTSRARSVCMHDQLIVGSLLNSDVICGYKKNYSVRTIVLVVVQTIVSYVVGILS